MPVGETVYSRCIANTNTYLYQTPPQYMGNYCYTSVPPPHSTTTTTPHYHHHTPPPPPPPHSTTTTTPHYIHHTPPPPPHSISTTAMPHSTTATLHYCRTPLPPCPNTATPHYCHAPPCPCSAGVGRTGTLISIATMMEMIAEREEINVFSFVMQMRANRNHMVQTEVGQLAHCYHCSEVLLKTVFRHLYMYTLSSNCITC